MDAPPPQEDVRPFVRIGRHLIELGLSAPAIHAEDEANGFLLLEDLGDDTFARVLAAGGDEGRALRPRHRRAGRPASRRRARAAAGPRRLCRRGADRRRDAAAGMVPARGDRPADIGRGDRPPIAPPGAPASPTCRRCADTLLLRDYHKDNLLWLPARPGVKACGLLDFQDAQQGHPSYDLVSLIEDARRDVAPAVHAACLDALPRRNRPRRQGLRAPASP